MRKRSRIAAIVERYFCLTTTMAVITIILASCSIDTNGYYSKGSAGKTECVKKTEFLEECRSQR
jgi:hypothetical protein